MKQLSFLLLMLAALPLTAKAQTETTDSLSYPGYQELDELVISADRPVLQSDGAKTTYNVEEDPSAASSNALEILKKVPMVSVDGDGTIRLKGQTNFKFQLNGLDNPMLQQYADKILQGMPASYVVKIEVITEPGAKEDAEGGTGIINIITELKKQEDGYTGTASLRLTARDFGPSVNTIVKKNKVTFSAGLNYQWGFSPQKGYQESTIDYLRGSQTGSLVSEASQEATYRYVGGNVNLSWEPDPNNLFTFGADIFDLVSDIKKLSSFTHRYSREGQLLWEYGQNGNGDLQMLNVSANASYRHNFAPEGNYLILSYLFNFGSGYFNFNQWGAQLEGMAFLSPFEQRLTNSINRGHTVQIDYANDFKSEHHLMEVGAKGIFRHNTANSGYLSGEDADHLLPVEGMDSYIIQPQDIYAAYASYTGKFSLLTAIAGLRYEHTRMGIDNTTMPHQSFINHLNDWVPNAALSLSFSPTSVLRAAYQMRISRPSIEQVNPFELALTPFEVRKGNPDLTSERIHNVSLSYSGFGRVFGGNISLEYTLVNNAIGNYTYLLNREGIDVLFSSYNNMGKTRTGAINGFCNWNIIPHMSLTLNGRLQYTDLKSPATGYRNHGWGGNIGGAWNYTLEEVNKFTAYGGWFARTPVLQGYTTGYYYYGISASRDFLKDRSLTIGVSANNFLQKETRYTSHSLTHDAESWSRAKNLTAWTVGVSVTWKFGNSNVRVKDTGVEIKNDDINQSSNKGAGGAF